MNPENPTLDIDGRPLYHRERLEAFDFIRFTLRFHGGIVKWFRPAGVAHKHLGVFDRGGNRLMDAARSSAEGCYRAVLEWACNNPRRFPRLFGRQHEILGAAYDKARRV